jgi:protein-S-isoprenylcysteine O-methyltransferase Ste14
VSEAPIHEQPESTAMEKRHTKFGKLFGSGPAGLLVSIILLFIAGWLNGQIGLPSLSDNRFLLNSIFAVSIFLTLFIIVWSVRSLPTADRGNKLCTSGAFRYVRHPLYAAFLSVFDFGLAVYLNSYIFILWAVLLHPIWHFLIQNEERLMIDIFGESYLEYQKNTGRFFPRLKILSG